MKLFKHQITGLFQVETVASKSPIEVSIVPVEGATLPEI